MLDDPDIAPYVVMLRNGNGAERPQSPGPSLQRIAPVGFKNGNGIQKEIAEAALPEKFTSEEVYRALTNANFKFTSKDHRGAVRDALFKLSHGKRPVFRVAHKGQGGQPNVYERVHEGGWD